ncbi:MAG TPA: hypothetical protein VJK52_05790 [Candidatus Nanoarchaeia archaeon]|nr:hypothetical protein [Candidatus Nanoarchaeia archaeon]
MRVDYRKFAFVLLFVGISIIAERINFSQLWGANNQFFTLFQFFGPIAGGFLGMIWGPVSVLVAELINFVLLGKTISLLNLLRLLPMVIAAFYFGAVRDDRKWAKTTWAIAPICIAIFLAHPEGRAAWYFAIYWTIPLLAMLPSIRDYLFARSLGATFTAHAVGGALWIWSTNMTAAQWTALVPIVAYERLLFAIGIAVSYVIFTIVLDRIPAAAVLRLEKRYAFSRTRTQRV